MLRCLMNTRVVATYLAVVLLVNGLVIAPPFQSASVSAMEPETEQVISGAEGALWSPVLSPSGSLTHSADGGQILGRNAHGDIGYVRDPNGSIAATTVYDPFGAAAGQTGTPGPLGFQGDYTDPTTGDVWMGARWYRPSTAAFTSRDTVFGQLGTPISLNRYTYAWANPLGMWDPDGRSPESTRPTSRRDIDFSGISCFDVGTALQFDCIVNQGGPRGAAAQNLGQFHSSAFGQGIEAAASIAATPFALAEIGFTAASELAGCASDASQGRSGGGCFDTIAQVGGEAIAFVDTAITNPTQLLKDCEANGAACLVNTAASILPLARFGSSAANGLSRAAARGVDVFDGASAQVSAFADASRAGLASARQTLSDGAAAFTRGAQGAIDTARVTANAIRERANATYLGQWDVRIDMSTLNMGVRFEIVPNHRHRGPAPSATDSAGRPFLRDYPTRNTANLDAHFSSEGEARALARTKLGPDPVDLGDNKLRSQDGVWQYRAKPVDTDLNHVHLERLDPETGEVLENWHLYWPEGRGR